MPAFEREIHRARAEAVFRPAGEAASYLGPVSRQNPKAEWRDVGLIARKDHKVIVGRRNRKRATVH